MNWSRLWKKQEGTAQVAKDRLQIIVARERTATGGSATQAMALSRSPRRARAIVVSVSSTR